MKALTILLVAASGCGDNTHANVTPDGPPPANRCLPTTVLETIDQHVEALRATADLTSTHPGAREAVGFFLFPRLELQRTAVFAGPLIMACNGAFMYDEFCEDDGLCSRIECTGEAAGWKMHFYVKAPVGVELRYSTATVDTHWVDGGTGITFDLAATTSGTTEDWSVMGSGEMDVMFLSVQLSYPALSRAGVVTVTAKVERDGTDLGDVVVDGEVVASVDSSSGHLMASEACR